MADEVPVGVKEVLSCLRRKHQLNYISSLQATVFFFFFLRRRKYCFDLKRDKCSSDGPTAGHQEQDLAGLWSQQAPGQVVISSGAFPLVAGGGKGWCE